MYFGLNNVTIKYDKRIIIDKLTLEIKKGTITALIGKNGAGKSTILKALAGAINPSDGNVLLEDKPLSSFKPKNLAKVIGYLPQLTESFSDIDVYTFVSYGRYPYKKFGFNLNENDKKIIDESLHITGLSGYKNTPLCRLSGGEHQRAWLAMILVQESQILLLDEPTTYLDVSYQLELLDLIKKLNQRLKLTVIMSLHDINLAAKYADWVIMIKDGKVCSQGLASEVLNEEELEQTFLTGIRVITDEANNRYFIPYRRENGDEK